MAPGVRPRSAALFAEAQKVLVGGVNSPVRAFGAVGGVPVFIQRAKGARVWDADGNAYLDYVGSWGPMILGHLHPAVAKAATRALANGSSFGAPTAVETVLARLLQEAFPAVEKVRFTSSGTEACLTALRLARAFTGRLLIVKFAGGYHGHVDGLLASAGSGALTFGRPTSAGVPPDVARLTLVLPYNDPDALEEAFIRHGTKIAAVIVELAAGNMGVVGPRPDFLDALERLSRRHKALLIADEVMTGFRLSWGGAQRLFALRADLTCFGKIAGGGFPVGGVGGPRRIMDQLAPLGPVYQAGTLSGNPVAMAAGAATLALLKRDLPYKLLRDKTDHLVQGILAVARRHRWDLTANVVESMFTIFFTKHPVTNLRSARRADAKAYARFFHALLKRGVYFPPSQFEAAFVSTAHSPADIETTIAAADAVFRDL